MCDIHTCIHIYDEKILWKNKNKKTKSMKRQNLQVMAILRSVEYSLVDPDVETTEFSSHSLLFLFILFARSAKSLVKIQLKGKSHLKIRLSSSGGFFAFAFFHAYNNSLPFFCDRISSFDGSLHFAIGQYF